ncbi:hypothetical protein IV203_030738 [Nitzschia inconspicua]|uniref:Uncharacterized protein n=1 Tax=Nitzschia inconspicua TaxID=303405 RepID=A0A9K3LU78_9STRA|nr:hypothetical protein IV203_030738 [Nitzschia inconspicua]
MVVNGKQCTVAWYVDDNKISLIDPQVVTDVITDIEGQLGKVTVTRGRHHKFPRLSDLREQDWNKLPRLLQHINGTISLPRILGGGTLTWLKTWVDTSYAVHPDFQSHTGGAVSLGLGTFMCKSQKQNLNTKSSTEAELVGASDYLPSTIWAKLFMEAQGYPITVNDFAQDNESAMKLELNGRASADIIHCPTEEMLADFFTIPLQGALFRKFRDIILGDKPLSSHSVPVTSLRGECVGRDDETNDALTENAEEHSKADAEKHSEAASRAGRNTFPEAPSRCTYADVLRRCEGSEANGANFSELLDPVVPHGELNLELVGIQTVGSGS